MIAVGTALSPSRLAGADNGLRPVHHLELTKDVGDMVAHGFLTQDETAGDLPVAVPLCNQPKNLSFSVGQVRKYTRERGLLQRREVLRQALGNGRTEDGLTMTDRVNGPQDLRLLGALQEIASCSCSHRRKDRIVVFIHREHQDPNVWTDAENRSSGFNPILPWHVQVHENHIGLKRSGLGNRFLAHGGLPDYVGFRDGLEQDPHSVTKEGMVISNQDTNAVHRFLLRLLPGQWEPDQNLGASSRAVADNTGSA